MLGGGGSATGRIRPAGGWGSIDIIQARTPSKPVNSTIGRFYWLTRDVGSRFVDLPPAGLRKPVERHNGRVYWPTRDVALGFVDFFHAPGRLLGTQTFRAAGVLWLRFRGKI